MRLSARPRRSNATSKPRGRWERSGAEVGRGGGRERISGTRVHGSKVREHAHRGREQRKTEKEKKRESGCMGAGVGGHAAGGEVRGRGRELATTPGQGLTEKLLILKHYIVSDGPYQARAGSLYSWGRQGVDEEEEQQGKKRAAGCVSCGNRARACGRRLKGVREEVLRREGRRSGIGAKNYMLTGALVKADAAGSGGSLGLGLTD
ncbi:hypothetical protein Pmani_034559 [Petrolisthes manimaculis]|uniref:Uncharacterized protein n=1 Tax=Petrolisthes manimaculis TaxID=1843537 RepID=A0AAE1NMH9_9EUCA|nr:hypothetical protein Pmani_034559 [Petrolisthes manimaculis]